MRGFKERGHCFLGVPGFGFILIFDMADRFADPDSVFFIPAWRCGCRDFRRASVAGQVLYLTLPVLNGSK